MTCTVTSAQIDISNTRNLDRARNGRGICAFCPMRPKRCQIKSYLSVLKTTCRLEILAVVQAQIDRLIDTAPRGGRCTKS